MQILCSTIIDCTFICAIFKATSILECIVADSVPSGQVEQSEHSCCAGILAKIWVVLSFWSFCKACCDQNMQLSYMVLSCLFHHKKKPGWMGSVLQAILVHNP